MNREEVRFTRDAVLILEERHKLVMLGARAENFHSMARITLRHEEFLCWAIQRAPAWIGPAYEVAEEHASTVALHAFFDLLQLIPLKADGEDMPENADSLERLRQGLPDLQHQGAEGKEKGQM